MSSSRLSRGIFVVWDSVLTFKEISLNYGNLDLFKEIFKEMVFLRKF